jgi:hypothetical protein
VTKQKNFYPDEAVMAHLQTLPPRKQSAWINAACRAAIASTDDEPALARVLNALEDMGVNIARIAALLRLQSSSPEAR